MPDQPLGLVPSARTCNSTRLQLGRLVSIGAVLLTMLTAFLTTQAHALPPGFIDELITDGIAAPTAIAVAPDGRLFVTEQGGAVSVVKGGVLLSQPFVQLSVNSSGERGLLGIAFIPISRPMVSSMFTTRSQGRPRETTSPGSRPDGDVAQSGQSIDDSRLWMPFPTPRTTMAALSISLRAASSSSRSARMPEAIERAVTKQSPRQDPAYQSGRHDPAGQSINVPRHSR